MTGVEHALSALALGLFLLLAIGLRVATHLLDEIGALRASLLAHGVRPIDNYPRGVRRKYR